jgi:hypothetical protein
MTEFMVSALMPGTLAPAFSVEAMEFVVTGVHG